jgi:flagellar assembly factor FliW
MKLKTKPYGVIDVDERQAVEFPFGIFGFENLKQYVLLDAEQQPFYWLQSTDVQDVAFILINPFLFRPDYNIDVPDEDLDEIDITDPRQALVFAIVTIPDNQSKMTANLQGPIIINKDSRKGRQSISSNVKWKVKHLILEELKSVGSTAC